MLPKSMAFRLNQIFDGMIAYTTVALATKSYFHFELKTFWPSAISSLHQYKKAWCQNISISEFFKLII